MQKEEEELLGQLEKELPIYEDYLKEIAEGVVEQKISKFPLFIAHKEKAISLGKPVIIAENAKTEWSINASVVEELVSRQILDEDKMLDFRHSHKDPKTHVLLFVATPGIMKFIYRPYTSK